MCFLNVPEERESAPGPEVHCHLCLGPPLRTGAGGAIGRKGERQGARDLWPRGLIHRLLLLRERAVCGPLTRKGGLVSAPADADASPAPCSSAKGHNGGDL